MAAGGQRAGDGGDTVAWQHQWNSRGGFAGGSVTGGPRDRVRHCFANIMPSFRDETAGMMLIG